MKGLTYKINIKKEKWVQSLTQRRTISAVVSFQPKRDRVSTVSSPFFSHHHYCTTDQEKCQEFFQKKLKKFLEKNGKKTLDK